MAGWTLSSSIGTTLIVAILLHVSGGICGPSEMLRLKDHLLANYDGLVRPVHDGISPTIVTFRMLLYDLLNMDTKNQRFKIMTWLKLTWIDEFLTWNATDFGGITIVHVKAEKLWLPDISLYETVDDVFERYKLDTYAQIAPNGNVSWYVPAIYTAYCRMDVRFFPFDTQSCEMKLSSWSYDGTHIDLRYEYVDQFVDFAENGVWHLKSFDGRRRVTKFPCCPEPFIDITYTIKFCRNSAFYINYLLLPCALLSILSLLVFYLPPDSGEKLTLSVTNLLAIVVFQQLVAENMPPSGEESALLGTYFLIMIVMVCISVVFTVFIIHVAFKKTPMPQWVETIFIKWLGRCVCVTGAYYCKERDQPLVAIELEKTAQDEESYDAGNAVNTSTKELCGKRKSPGSGLAPSKEEMVEKWQLVSLVVDRVLMIIFTIFAFTVTIAMLAFIVYHSEPDDAHHDDHEC